MNANIILQLLQPPSENTESFPQIFLFFMEEFFKTSGCFSKAYPWFSEPHERTSKQSRTLRKHERFLIMYTHSSGSYTFSSRIHKYFLLNTFASRKCVYILYKRPSTHWKYFVTLQECMDKHSSRIFSQKTYKHFQRGRSKIFSQEPIFKKVWRTQKQCLGIILQYMTCPQERITRFKVLDERFSWVWVKAPCAYCS